MIWGGGSFRGNTSDSPAVGQGQVTIVVDEDGATYSNKLTVSGTTTADLPPVGGVSAIHLHNAPADANGPVITDLVQAAGGDVNGATADGDVILQGAFEEDVEDFDDAYFLQVDDGDQFVFSNATFSTAAIQVDGQNVTIGGDLQRGRGFASGNLLAATNDGQSTVVQFVDELLGDGEGLIEGRAVDAGEIDGIAFEEFVTGNGIEDDGTDFTITLDNSTSGLEISFGVFVYDIGRQPTLHPEVPALSGHCCMSFLPPYSFPKAEVRSHHKTEHCQPKFRTFPKQSGSA